MRKFELSLLVAGLLVVLIACGQGDAGDSEEGAAGEELDELTFGFIPWQEGALEERADPLADALSEELGVPVEADVLTNYIGLVEAMGNEQVDVGALTPFAYVLAKDRYPETQALLTEVHDGSPFYRSEFVVRSGSDIESLEDLEGRDVAFVDPASTSGYLFPLAQLVEEGLIEEGAEPDEFFGNAIFAGSHDNALTALLNEEVEAAAIFDDAPELIEDEFPDVEDRIETLGETEEIPQSAFSVRPGISEEAAEEIQEAYAAAVRSEENQEVFEEIYGLEDVVEADDADYDVIREAAAATGQDIVELVEE